MKPTYQKIIIPTLSLILTSCGGGSGSGSENSAPTAYNPGVTRNNSSQSDSAVSSSTPHSTVDAPLNLELSTMPNSTSQSEVSTKPSVSSSKTRKNNFAPEEHPNSKNGIYSVSDTYQSEHSSHSKQGNISPPHNSTHNIQSSGTIVLNSNLQYINDEHVVKDIGIIDTSYYLSDSFKDANGNQRLKIHDQFSEFDEITNSHGTSVVAVINRYNNTATMYAYNTHHDSSYKFLVKKEDYDKAHAQGVRIFNNSYGGDATREPKAGINEKNTVQYAKNDSIFVWAAGNENQDHGTPQALYPMIDDNVRNGWISVAEVEYGNGVYGTTERKKYTATSSSNYIGEKAKSWGIAAQGEYHFLLKNKNASPSSKRNSLPTIGTSFSAPRVTAAAANVWTKFPWMDHHLVVVSILSTADKPGTFLPGQDDGCGHSGIKECGIPTSEPEYKFGWGLLNERRALKGPALFDKRLLTNKDAKLLTNDEIEQNSNISGQNSYKDLLVVNFDFRNYTDKEKLTWSNDIKGDAGILKQGSGTLYLTGKNAYQGKTIVDGGVLAIGHSLTSPVIIKPNGTLLTEFATQKYHNSASTKVTLGESKNQSSTSSSYTVKNSGSLNVYGAGLTINGDYKGEANSRIVIDIDKSTLDVTGTMDMGNTSKIVADVKDLSVNGIPTQQAKEKKLITAHKITNHQHITYAKSDNINQYIDISHFSLKDDKEINVTYKRNSTQYVLKRIEHTPKSALQTASNLDPVLDSLANSTTYHQYAPKAASLFHAKPERLSKIIDSLSGEIYASTQSAMINQNLVTNQVLSQRIMSVTHGSANGFWVEGMYANSKINQQGYASANIKTTGSQIGIDTPLSDVLSLGVAFTQSHANAEFNRDAGESKIKNMGAFVYGSYQMDQAYLATIAGINHANSRVDRVVFEEQTQAKFNSQLYNFYNEIGTRLNLDSIKLNPFIAHSFNHINRGAFKETVAFGINAQDKTYNINTFMLGLRSDIELDKLTLNANITHAYTPQHHQFGFDAKFTGFDNPIHIKGAEHSKHRTWLGLGASYELIDGFNLQLSYHLSTQQGKKENDAINLGVLYRF
ncbi:putative serine protease [Pasteurella multocida subsp. multocida OH4807]|nr:putative serine protease [Pasteurella multocida subsp. multocida OH4807]